MRKVSAEKDKLARAAKRFIEAPHLYYNADINGAINIGRFFDQVLRNGGALNKELDSVEVRPCG